MKFNLFVTLMTALFFIACSNGGGGSGGDSGNNKKPDEGQKINPSDLNLKNFPNVQGKAYGSWASQEIVVKGKDGRKVSLYVNLYIAKSQTAFRLKCAENRKQYADLAGVVKSELVKNDLTFKESLFLSQDELCNVNINKKTLNINYRFHNQDSFTLDSQDSSVFFHRTNESPDGEDPDLAPPADKPGNDGNGNGGGNGGDGSSIQVTFYAQANCTGQSWTILYPNQCSIVAQTMVSSVSVAGSCKDLNGTYPGSAVCK